MSVRRGIFVAFMLGAAAVLFGLGWWQWQRRTEKAAFIAAMEQASRAPAVPLAGAPLWQRVTLEGRYLHQHVAYVRTSRLQGSGSEFGVKVMVPFVTRICGAEGRCTLTTLYVDRGFLPTTPDGKIPAYDRPEEALTLVGILRPAEATSMLQPGNDPAKGVWFGRDIAAMAKAKGLAGAEGASPYDRFVEREASSGESPPFGLEVKALAASIPDNHLSYALTWWGLMLTDLLVLIFFLRRRRESEEAR